MISFGPTEEQELVRNTLRDFAAQVLRPAARAADEASELPSGFLDQVWELGLTGTQLPSAVGGGGEECQGAKDRGRVAPGAGDGAQIVVTTDDGIRTCEFVPGRPIALLKGLKNLHPAPVRRLNGRQTGERRRRALAALEAGYADKAAALMLHHLTTSASQSQKDSPAQ